LPEQHRVAPQFVGAAHHRARPRHHVLPERGQLVALADPVEQPSAQVLLERLDAAAERRLRDVRAFGRAAEGSGLGDRQQVLEVSDVHRRSSR
jgi:hypothetical protein